MTENERGHLESLDSSKIKRIARGSGRTEAEVKAMIKAFCDKK
jgi:signal recognition particle GTPase